MSVTPKSSWPWVKTLLQTVFDQWPLLRGWDREPIVRPKSVAGFPYGVIYYATDSEIVIVAYAHEKRRPGYWKHRVKG